MGSSNIGTVFDVIAAQDFPRRRARGASHAHDMRHYLGRDV